MFSLDGVDHALDRDTCDACGRTIGAMQPYCAAHCDKVLGLAVRRSTIAGAGHGLYATRDFARTALLCPYVARRATVSDIDRLYGDRTAAYAVADNEGGVWDAAFRRGIAAFANKAAPAACNAELVDPHPDGVPARLQAYAAHPWIRATRPIRAGAEILLDYGAEYTLHGAIPATTHFGVLPGAMVQ
jgi:hypothetical protein